LIDCTLHADFETTGDSDHALKISRFTDLIHTAPELQHIGVSRLKGNHEKCTNCTNIEARVQAAIKGKNSTALHAAKEDRHTHLKEQKAGAHTRAHTLASNSPPTERVYYYSKRLKGQKGLCTSAIQDKWDQKKVVHLLTHL
jgi:hypothetical protein